MKRVKIKLDWMTYANILCGKYRYDDLDHTTITVDALDVELDKSTVEEKQCDAYQEGRCVQRGVECPLDWKCIAARTH